MKGLERRLAAGLAPDVPSVASVFISRWDRAVTDKLPAELQNKLGIAVAEQAYKSYRELLRSDRWQALQNCGARAQRLLYASTSMKNPNASDVLYIEALASPHTVNTMPEGTLKAFADHGKVGALVPEDGGDSESALAAHAKQGIDADKLAAKLQEDGAKAFVDSWKDLLKTIDTKSKALK
ncbi:MAG: hypothetical protein JO122_21470 [Acetobacteraceae bacterium]|nr:hypothetical protein [Acetobacteraceae bacterium]